MEKKYRAQLNYAPADSEPAAWDWELLLPHRYRIAIDHNNPQEKVYVLFCGEYYVHSSDSFHELLRFVMGQIEGVWK